MKTRLDVTWMAIIGLVALSACKNPADDVPAAQVEPVGASGELAVEAAEGSEAEDEGSAAPDPTLEPPVEAELRFDQNHGSIAFVGSKVTASHEGSFQVFSGTIRLAEAIEESKVSVEIQTTSLVADRPRLTQHLKSEEFLDVAAHPTATFASTEITASGDGSYVLQGDLELHGHTRTISFPARIDLSAPSVNLAAEFSINRRDFGIIYPGAPDDLIRDEVVIRLAFDVPRQ